MRDGQVARISLYKAFLFAHIARALKAGTLNLEHSYKSGYPFHSPNSGRLADILGVMMEW